MPYTKIKAGYQLQPAVYIFFSFHYLTVIFLILFPLDVS